MPLPLQPSSAPSGRLEWVLFDADDTLWHTESRFQLVQKQFVELLKPWVVDSGHLEQALAETETRNLPLFGYGVKGFVLSMIESAIQLTDARVDAKTIHNIMMLGRTMLGETIDILNNVQEVLRELGRHYRLGLITKGDLLDQGNKIRDSGLESFFSFVEIVVEKNETTYDSLFQRHGIEPVRAMMVGNSIPSDVLPPLMLGCFAVHIPYVATASFEQHDRSVQHDRFFALEQIAELPSVLRSIEEG